jgi:hypothetical protein
MKIKTFKIKLLSIGGAKALTLKEPNSTSYEPVRVSFF